ncbi:MAG: Hemin import ATP-binding protein HmuV [Firmicutes bacterium ADurb.Bin182]|nr:MAG: Hemin import ATP-binding protein HmuV [Firmicutes bacterium ADurb.Bin182]
MLEVKDLTVEFNGLTAVDDVSFSVEEGQWLMVAGPNGSGKTTIINAVSKSVHYSGTVKLLGKDVRKYKPYELARAMGVLKQNHAVNYPFTVEEVVRLGRYAYAPGPFSHKSGEDDIRVYEAMNMTGLDHIREQSVMTLSGGELQRTFLAQLFAQSPNLLMLDEPTSHLDLVYQKQTFELIREWLKAPGRAVISVVHDLSLIKAYGTRAMLLSRGKVKAEGEIGEVLTARHLDPVYSMDVYAWMRELSASWQ